MTKNAHMFLLYFGKVCDHIHNLDLRIQMKHQGLFLPEAINTEILVKPLLTKPSCANQNSLKGVNTQFLINAAVHNKLNFT